MRSSPYLRIGVLLLAIGLASPVAWAQGTTVESGATGSERVAPPEPQAIAPAAVADRSDALRDMLRGIALLAEPTAEVTSIEEELPERVKQIQERSVAARRLAATSTRLDQLTDETRYWTEQERQLLPMRRVPTERALLLEAQLDELDRLSEIWKLTGEKARASGSPRAVLDLIEQSRVVIAETRKAVQARRSDLLRLQGRIAEVDYKVSEVLVAVDSAQARAVSLLIESEAPPLWKGVVAEPTDEEPLDRIRRAARTAGDAIRTYVDASAGRLVFQGALFVALLAITIAFRPRAAKIAAEDAAFEPTAMLFERPVSMAVLLAIAVTPWLHPTAPAIVESLFIAAALIPLLRLVPAVAGNRGYAVFVALTLLLITNQVRNAMEALPGIERLLLLAACILAAAATAWLLRPARLGRVSHGDSRLFRVAVGVRLSLVLFVLAVLFNFFGYVDLARLLFEGTAISAYLAILFSAAAMALQGLFRILLRVRPLKSLRAIQSRRAAVARFLNRGLRVGVAVAWVFATLTAFAIREPVFDAVRTLVRTELAFGSISLSLGSVLSFLVALGLGYLLSRLLRTLLEEELTPRTQLPRGVGYALAVSVQYVVLVLAFFLAVGAAGMELGRFALVAGALGVGVGFGLQNVVNNFVSGLILLFERPVQIGDTIETEGLTGEVRRIGIRSSTVRTWQGAEIVIPNSALVSERLTNWTMSDRMRRLEVRVGVAYGTDPHRVIEILKNVARSNDEVIGTPEPIALFLGFGDSSLDFELRAWTMRAQTFMQLHSALALAIHDALVEEGITVPFPQRDLHVVSLPGGGAPDPQPETPEGPEDD